jgi:hypothetical protein
MPLLYGQTSFTILDLGLGLGLDKASADYDNDGDNDLLTCNGLYRNDSGNFSLVSGTGLPTMPVGTLVRWIDFNNDGHLDLYVNLSSNVIYINNGQGVFSMMNVGLPNLGCSDAEFADYDNDDDLDVILVGTYYNTKIYENVNGMYVYVNYGIDNPYAGGCDWGDYDNDGDLDFVLTGRMGNMRIYRNDTSQSGIRSFNNVLNFQMLEGSDVEWGDYDCDGDLDILVIGEVGDYSSNYTWVYRNDNGTFTNINAPLVGANYGNVDWLDLDNDGDLDIIAGGLQNEAANPDVPYSAIYINNNGLYSVLMDFPYQHLGISTFDYDSDGDIDVYLTYNWYNPPSSWPYSSIMLRNEFVPPGPPEIINVIEPVVMNMNDPILTIVLSDYFADNGSALVYSYSGNQNISCNIIENAQLTLVLSLNWYGSEYITVRATNQWNYYVEQTFKVTVIQTWQTTEDFNHAGDLPANWTTQHSGTTDFPWQPVLIEAEDYAMKTTANTGRTANERLFSPTYNLSNYKDIVVSFDTGFLPYGTGSGTFAYTLNNVTYTVVETFSASTGCVKTYTIPNLDAKPSVKFRWLYANSNTNTGQENYWIVDDFSIFGIVSDTQSPIAVNGLALVSQSLNSASMSWQSSSDLYFGRYELYVSTDEQVSTTDQLWSTDQDPALYNVGNTTTTITGLATGDYWIAIRAVDQSNNASALSDPLFVHIDGEAPVFSNPIPDSQPGPLWTNSRIVNIGCSISDYSTINPNNLFYRIDANGNGLYDESEPWVNVPQSAIATGRDALNILLEVIYAADGILAFEFKATDFYGNTGYSGQNAQEGITDDWVVRIDALAPVFSSAIPINQPEPDWLQTQAVQIGCSIEDMNLIQTIEYRLDSNGNGSYDPEEAWQSFTPSRSINRNLLLVEVPVEFAVDGVCSFEFKATDMLGNVSYSGFDSQEGIQDDWVVRMDTTAPIFIDPIPANQPNPIWDTQLEVQIGATIYDYNDIDQSSVMYRIDLNRNGSYDLEEEWMTLMLRAGSLRNSILASTTINVPTDGVYAFEFRAADSFGNVGYSGQSATNGIEDDWMIKVDTNPPFFCLPIPGDQPLPLWSNNYSVTIGATILDSIAIDMNSVQYRYDQNQNGVYDPEENWQNITPQRSRTSRSIQVPIEVNLELSSDGIYKYEFRASDPNGVTGFSGISHLQGIVDDWIFRIDTIAPAEITNFFAQEITDTSVQLTWAASADTNFLGYRIHYSTSPEVSIADPCWDWNNDPILGFAGSNLVSAVVTGLNPATRYYFILLATDEVGWVTQFPQVITAMTNSSAEPMAPANLTISIVNGLLILDWDDVTQDILGNPIVPSCYEVFVGDNPEFICNFDSLISTVNESYLELEDIVEYADRLFFKVIALTGMIRTTK